MTEQNQDLVQKLEELLQEDLLEWNLLSESAVGDSKTDKQRLWSKGTNINGTKLAATEQMFRV